MPLARFLRLLVCFLTTFSWLRAAETLQLQAVDLSLLPAHPRLIAKAEDWARLEQRRAKDPELEAYVQELVRLARIDLRQPRLERKMQGKRLLFVSRQLIQSVLLCSFAQRVTGEKIFFEKARADLLDVAAFTDWNPSHFLDVAEMATGVALAYDWLHAQLSEEERALIRRALIDKALKHGEKGNPTFTKDNNWAQVCGGGLALAALAVAEDEPALATAVLGHVKAGLKHPLAVYAPDGCYPEGASYWSYGTLYHIVLVSALRSALGEDWGIMASPGFLRSAQFEAQCTGPTGLLFNFADSGSRDGINEALCYMARELKQPALAWNTRRILSKLPSKLEAQPERLAPLLAFWWPWGAEAEKAEPPARFFTGAGTNAVAIWRSAWLDTNARYFALKAGGAAVSHGHMDGGSFVLDWRGERWAADLGMQEYNPLEIRGIKLWDMSQDSQRWGIFRIGSTAHNTLTLDGARHEARGLAKLLRADEKGAEIDLTPILRVPAGAKILRRVIVDNTRIVIEDEATGLQPGQCIRWAMTSPAKIRLEGNQVLLTKGSHTLTLHFKGDALSLSDEDISQPKADFDVENPKMRQLVARIQTNSSGQATLRVIFEAAE